MVSQDQLKSLLDYDHETGIFTWKKTRSFKASCGSIAGHFSKSGYVTISIGNKNYLAHRLAWMYMHGSLPECELDHVDGDKSNNRISNLRADHLRENQQNRRRPGINNTSGYLGVSWNRSNQKWKAQIKANGKHHNLGLYSSPHEAHEAYLKAKREQHRFCTI